MSYIIFNGIVPPNIVIRHKCNNPRCVNPKHLLLGNQSDNERDKLKAGNHPQQKLNEEAVKVIKWMLKYKNYWGLAAKLARLHHVSSNTISGIKKGNYWWWVTV